MLIAYPALRIFFPNRITYAEQSWRFAGLYPLRTLGIVTGTSMKENTLYAIQDWSKRAEMFGDHTGALIYLPT